MNKELRSRVDVISFILDSCFLIQDDYNMYMSENANNGINEIPEINKSESWLKHELWDLAKVILVSAAIVFPIRYFIAQPFIVRGASMEPNFHNRDYLIIDEISYFLREPKRGETVVFRYPRDPGQYFIKRIVGLPGEKIEIKDGRLKVYNQAYPDGFVLDETNYLVPPDRLTSPDSVRDLGRDEYFVLGDNRDFSSDSRIWGVLNRKFIVGRAVFRAWPVGGLGMVPDYSFVY